MRFLAAVTALVLGAGLLSAAPAEAAVPAPTPVVVGNQLVDSRTGAVFVPHGANWPSFEYACWQGWGYSRGYSATEATTLASWGINVVRIPLNQDCWLGLQGSPAGAGRTAQGYRDALRAWVGMLNAAGIVALLDLHSSAPAGAAAHGQRAMPDAQSVAFWSSVAADYAANRSVMFDIFNEPYSRWNSSTSSWTFNLTWDCWRNGGCSAPVEDDYTAALSGATYPVTGMAALVAAVRAAGAPQPVLLGGLDYSNDLRGWLANRPNDTQLVASWHNYPGQRCHTTTCWNAEIAPVAAVVPVVTGEFGQTDGGSGYLTSFMDWADAHGVGYLPWAWWNVAASEDLTNSRYALVDAAMQPKAPSGTAYHDHLAALQPPVTPSPTPTPTPTPSVTPKPTPKPTPTPTPAPVKKTTTTLTASSPTQYFSEASGRVTLTAKVSAGAGSVVFREGTTVLGTVKVASGKAALVLPATLALGAHSITATFTPTTAGYTKSTSAAVSVRVWLRSRVTVTLAPATAAPGKPYTTTVRVAVPGTRNPRGIVTVYLDGVRQGSWSLSATMGGILTLRPAAPTKLGKHTVYADYSGTVAILPSTSTKSTLTVAR